MRTDIRLKTGAILGKFMLYFLLLGMGGCFLTEKSVALPGAQPYLRSQEKKIRKAMKELPKDYVPRTKHKNEDGSPKFTNLLISQTSPYLLQHAHNPVKWYPWGDEAFETARREKKPVLLSVGYATCHWCHVMEEESFEDLEIAEYLNQNYVAIKVDREQRPDVDSVYMSAVQMISRHGGWPMTVWLTPDRKPFYGGTYFPARDGDRGGSMGFLTVLKRMLEVYQTQGEDVLKQAQEVATAISEQSAFKAELKLPSVEAQHSAYRSYEDAFDETHGGFGLAPKFPRPVTIDFLMQYSERAKSEKAKEMAFNTLRMMARGGMYDQVGGGFHRYATDATWLVPHFEKMLYDNAQLVLSYLEAYQLTNDGEFRQTVEDTLNYVSREMTTKDGAFFSATDADSEGEEGKFFVWSKKEILEILGKEDGEVFSDYYGVTESGNFEGANILHVTDDVETFSKKKKLTSEKLRALLNNGREKLYGVRSKRIPPLTDDKVLAGWNGLMIAAYARAGWVLGNSDYLKRAQKAAEFILKEMKKGSTLYRSYRNGKAEVKGYLDDHAFLAMGFLELFEATQEVKWLKEARALQDELLSKFWDEKNGGFFMTGKDHEKLIAKDKPYYDGAEPSGNSVAIMNLLRLSSLTTEKKYREKAKEGLQAFGRVLEQVSHISPMMLQALDYYFDRSKEIIIIEPETDLGKNPLRGVLRDTYVPNRVVMVVTEGKHQKEILSQIPLVQAKTAIGGKATAYVCENQSCELPTSDPAVFLTQLKKVDLLEVLPNGNDRKK